MSGQAHGLEQQVWELLKDEAGGDTEKTVRIAKLAGDRLPVPHKQWTTELVRSWANRGLVVQSQNGARAHLTGRGLDTDEVDE